MGVCIPKNKNIKDGTCIQEPDPSLSVIADSNVHTDIQKTYEFKKLIGHGQFGTVREAVRLGTEHYVAVKSINKEKIKTDLHLLKRELEIMRMIDHPNLIKFYETFEDEKYLHIVMELCSGGDLFDKLLSMGAMNEGYVASVLRKLLLAVNHLHGLSICHRDLKPENFLYVTKDAEAEIKIIDFGMSIKMSRTNELTTFVGTPYYLAPEVLKGKYGRECDIWSLGVIMYLMLCGYQPFEGDDMREIFSKISKAHYEFPSPEWDNVTDQAKDLVRKMLNPAPNKRIPISEILRHTWFVDQIESRPTAVSGRVLATLKKYRAPKKLQAEVMRVMIKFMTTDDMQEMRDVFLELDRERTGFITVNDLEAAMESSGYHLPAEELKSEVHTDIINTIDYLKQGKIKYSDFLVATMDRKRLMDEELLFLTFKHFDYDNDGNINVQDLRLAISNAGDSATQQEIEEMIADWDLDNNRLIDFEEFKKMMADSEV